jgi:hypothetical protein
LVTNIETGKTVEYVSQSAAAKELGVSTTAVRKCLKSWMLLTKNLPNYFEIQWLGVPFLPFPFLIEKNIFF